MTIETQSEQSEEMSLGFIAALPTILWERRWLLIVPLVVATVAGLVAAYTIPPVYESSATVLIESQQLPVDLPGPQTNDPIGQRVARARERVLSRMDLIRLIRQHNLYPGEQKTQPLSKIVETMRNDTTIAAVDSSLTNIGAKRNLGLVNTIAITIAFDYEDPVKAQIVAQQFVNHFLEVDAATQASQAIDSVNFLTEQADSIQGKIADIENQVTKIKTENGTLLALGQSTGDQAGDLSRIDSQIVGLQAESAKLASSASTVAGNQNGVAVAEAALRTAQARYSDSHPDVIAAKAQLDAARRAAAVPASANPVTAQIASNRAQIASLQRARAMIASQSSSLQAAQSRAPALVSKVDQLEKRADSLREQYRGIGAQLQAAQIQARMQTEQKGERLTLADPPVVPDHPTKPNRPMIILGSIAAGAGLGVGLILLIELLLRPIRGTAALKRVLGEAPLTVIPDFDQKAGWIVRMLERRTRRKLART
jgi:uncharacterized protein involved in exopolysaccharide biosynthesis